MLATAKTIAFVATTNPARARAFYEQVLGLSFVVDEPFALVFDANGTSKQSLWGVVFAYFPCCENNMVQGVGEN